MHLRLFCLIRTFTSLDRFCFCQVRIYKTYCISLFYRPMKYVFETYLFENLHQINVLIFSQPCSVENFYLLSNYFCAVTQCMRAVCKVSYILVQRDEERGMVGPRCLYTLLRSYKLNMKN